MIAPLFGACALCGRPVRRPGDRLCTFHEIRFLIDLGAERMRQRAGRKPDTVISIKQNQIQKIKGV